MTAAQHRVNKQRTLMNSGPKYLAEPFDINSENVGPNFQGHDIAAIFELMKKTPELAAKSEFESSDQFKRRQQSLASKDLTGSLKFDSYLAFVIDYDIFYGAHFKYDADAQTLSVTLTGKGTTFDVGSDGQGSDTIIIRSVETYRDTYIGRNAFGAEVKVTRIDSDEHGIVFQPNSWPFSDHAAALPQFSAKLPMSAEEARNLKPEAKLIIVCKLSYPWIGETYSGHDPTIDSPYERNNALKYLQVVPEQLWLINGGTGAVVHKFSESEQAARSSASDGAITNCAARSEMQPLQKVEPKYPDLARLAQIQGDVQFTATIDADGRITNLDLVRGHPLLVNAARNAALQYRYSPALMNGKAICATTNVSIQFRLSQH